MLFSQYIYTSWNNGSSPDKGFMVYGKSRDVTEDEDKEIQITMRYRPFKSLPYLPTQLQIENDFPKNYAVFKLRSGRMCIALASYIGLDYVKDDNSRWGNYIIHAFIADVAGNPVPHLLNAGLFKTFLSKEEQDAPTGPHILDHIDIPVDYTPCESSVCELSEEVWNIAQATIDAKLTGANVFINVDQSMVNSLADSLIQILPLSVSKTLSYSTYMLNKNPRMTVNFIHKESPTFCPEEEILNTDNFVFYASLQSRVILKNYILHMKNIYNNNGDIVTYKKNIDEICIRYQIDDSNVACDILDFLNGDTIFCSSIENVQKILALFNNNNGRVLSQISDEIVSVLEKFGKLYYEDKYLIMNTIYAYINAELQSKYKTEIWSHIYQNSNDIASIICGMKKYSNVYTQDITLIIENYLVQTIMSSKSVNLAKEYCIANYNIIKNPELLEWYEKGIKSEVIAYIKSNNYDNAKNIIETQLKKCDDYDRLIVDVFNEVIMLNFVGEDLVFDFYMIGLVSNDLDLYLKGIQNVLSTYPPSGTLINKMEQSIRDAKCMVGVKIEDYLDKQFPKYFIERDKLRFFGSSHYTRKEICEFYKKHVVGMLDNITSDIVEQFNKRLYGYLTVLSDEQKLNESCLIFRYIMGLDTSRKINKSTLEILYKTAFSNIGFEKLVMCDVKEDDIVEMNYYAMVFDVSLLPATLLYKDYLWFKKHSSLQDVIGVDIQQSTEDIDFYYLNTYCSADDRHSFMLITFDLIVKFLVKYIDVSKRELFFERLTGVFTNYKDYQKIFVKHLLSYNYYNQEHLMVFNYCNNNESTYSAFLKDHIWLIYLKKLGKRDREVLFTYLQNKSDDKDLAIEYIKQYELDSKSFFKKLFFQTPKGQSHNTSNENAKSECGKKRKKG